MLREYRYEISSDVKLLYERFLRKEISKKEFVKLLNESEQCKQIVKEQRAKDQRVDYLTIERRPEDADYCIYAAVFL